MTRDDSPIIVSAIKIRLSRGDIEGAAAFLFSKANQKDCTDVPYFWYAQILIAALQGKGFHLTFLTAYEASPSPYHKGNGERRIVTIEAMITFFKQYLNDPLYKNHRQKIEELIAFYENGTCEDPFKNTVVPTTTSDPL